jgi:hypothetical protein
MISNPSVELGFKPPCGGGFLNPDGPKGPKLWQTGLFSAIFVEEDKFA